MSQSLPSWNELYDRSLSAYSAGDMSAGRLACDLLMNHPDAGQSYRANARCNAVHYALTLREIVDLAEIRIDIPVPEGWFAFNPSIIADGNGFLLSARCGNYAMPGWVIAPGDDRYRSLTAVMRLDASGSPVGEPRLLADFTMTDDERDDKYVGIEDVRLVRAGGRLMAAGSAARRLGPERQRTVCFGLFDVDLDGGALVRPRWLSSTPGTVEKNWMPAARGDDLHFIYRCGPTTVLRTDPATGASVLAAEIDAPQMAEGMRGGTQLILDGDGWIALVHESAEWEPGRRTYLHRVVRFGADWRITHLSHPFRFQREDLEFAAGLARSGSDLLIAYGVGDRECRLARVPASQLTGLLLPVGSFGEGIAAARPPLPGERVPWAADASAMVMPEWQRRVWAVAGSGAALDADQMPLVDSTRVGRMWGYPGDRVLTESLRQTGDWEPVEGDFAESVLRPGMNAIDIGANIGYFTRLFAQAVGPSGRVLAVEANPAAFSVLERNALWHGPGNVTALNVAVADRFGHAVIERGGEAEGNPGANRVVMAGSVDADVEMIPLEAALNSEMPIHLVKVDLEGLDHRALAGLQRAIERWRPVIIAEWSPKAIASMGDDPAGVLGWYLDNGWRVYVLQSVIDHFRLARGLRSRLRDGVEITRETVEWIKHLDFPTHMGMMLLDLVIATDPGYVPVLGKPGCIRQNVELAFAESLDAWGEQRYDDGLAACEHVLSRDDAGDHNTAFSLRNELFYARHLAESIVQRVETTAPSDGNDGPRALALPGNSGYVLEQVWPLRVNRHGAPVETGETPPLIVRRLNPVGAVERADGWLVLMEQMARFDGGIERRLHRFASLDRSFAFTRVSEPFWLVDRDRDRALGMEERGGLLVIPVRLEPDGELAEVSVPARIAESMLVSFEERADDLLLNGRPPLRLEPPATAAPESEAVRPPELPQDFREETYLGLLDYLHREWQPEGYLEIGIEHGVGLAKSRTASVGVDPNPRIREDIVSGKPWVKVFAQASDDFFAEWTREQVFGSRRLDLTFVDGLHLFEFALRDIMNVEKWSHPGGLILVHDVIPNSLAAAGREFNPGDWEGDVWRVIPALQRWRPDLRLHILSSREVPFTGMLVISALNPDDTLLSDNLERIIAEGLDEAVPYAEQFQSFLATVPYKPVNKTLGELRHWRSVHRKRAIPPPAAAGGNGLTLVSALIDTGNSMTAPEARVAMLRPLLDSGIPLVLYMDASYRSRLDASSVPPWVRIVPMEFDDLAVARRIATMDPPPTLPSNRLAVKDSAEFMTLMNAKTELVSQAVDSGLIDTPYTGFIDSGLSKIFADVSGSLERVRSASFHGLRNTLIPGCRPPGPRHMDALTEAVDWTFCGGLFIMPTSFAGEFHREALAALEMFLEQRRIVWEVNVWSKVASEQPGLFHWFQADHDDRLTMFPALE